MRHWRISLFVLLVLAVTKPILPQENDDKKKEQRKQLLREMRNRAEAIKLYALRDKKRSRAELVAQPIFRYSDQPRDILDATLWAWKAKGRPVALLKVESYRETARGPKWVYCMTSLSSGLIEAKWTDGRRFASKKPGLKLQKFPDGPKPADSKVARLRQIKQLARRFSATEFLIGNRSLGEMRLLPRPIYRYADPDSGIRDGAVFVLSLNGTNPDGVLVIELEQRDSAEFSWRFGPARLTNGGLSVRLDDKQVWRVPDRPGPPAAFDTWMWFRILSAKGK